MVRRKLLILCLGLAVLCLSSSLPPFGNSSVSATPDRLKWSIVDTPSEEGNVVVTPSEINAFVIGSDKIFYAIDIPNGKVYKSTDCGITWDDDLTQSLVEEGATLPVWDMAVAPGDADLIAVVTNERHELYVSEDGGDSWADTHVSAATGWDADLLISDIAISPEFNGNRHIAIGTRNPDGSTNGDVWVIKSELFAGWKAQDLNMDVSSVRFSPDHDSAKTILVIASDVSNTYLCTGIRNTDENTTNWDVTDPSQVEISEMVGDSPGESEIIFSDLALPSDYLGEEAGSRIVYVAYSSNTTAGDVYLVGDTEVTRLDVKHGDRVPIASIAYQGTCSRGKLLAGEVAGEAISAGALIYICSNPRNTYPDWEEPSEPPTGGAFSGYANAQVAWSSDGETAYCGTSTNHVTSANDWALPASWSGQSLDESAFSVSKDDADTWNQLSLIDTQMGHLCDFALSADYETLYLASVGSGFDSLWRSESDPLGETWHRILCLDSEGEEIILRPTTKKRPKEAVFFAVVDSHRARYSLDKGETWELLWDCPHITDLAVITNEMFYILDDNLVNKCTWNEEMWEGIWEWERDIDTGLSSAYTIAVSGEDFVFVAEDKNGEGKVACSADGGATFELTEAVPEPGNMQVIPDEDFSSNRFIYAASDSASSKIYRWSIGGSTSWRQLNPRHSGFYGLAQKGGALYGAYGSGVDRTLIPHEETVTPSDWDSLTAGLVSGAILKPGSLKAMRGETIDLWAIDDSHYDFKGNTGCLWVYSDTFVLETPWPTSPAIGGLLPCDPCACQARTFCFRWRELPLAEEYELWIAMGEEFTEIIDKVENIVPADPHDPAWCPPASSLRFVCGETYYWKVRSCQSTEGETIHSRWSPPMHFIVKTGSAVGHMHIAPVLEVPENGSRDVSRSPGFSWVGFPDTTKYEFVLARDATLTQVIIREEVSTSAYHYGDKLDWGTTYFWQAKAVEPVPSEPAIGTFTVMPEPRPVASTPPPPKPATPLWIWVVIGILASLNVVIIVLCLVKRR